MAAGKIAAAILLALAARSLSACTCLKILALA